MSNFNVYARLTKIDEATRRVWGRATQEVPDRSGEIMDYATSKPEFEKWSGEMAKVTDGVNLGNVRSMHSKNAAGKLVEIDFNDSEKAVDVCAEIVDENDWQKCMKGVYTGFSIGGSAKRWRDDQDSKLMRYTAYPVEVSLVDMPCVPTATFSLVKADGMTADVPLVGDPDAVADREAVDALAKVLDAGEMKPAAILELVKAAQAKADEEARAAKLEELKKSIVDEATLTVGVVEKLAGDHMTAEEIAAVPGEGLQKVGGLIGALRKIAGIEETPDDLEKVAERDDADPKEGEDKYGDVAFADEKNKKYPIDTEPHIRAAWNYINKPKNAGKYSDEDAASIKSKIVAAWKKKIDKDGPPSAAEKAVTLGDHALAKGMYTVAWLAQVIESLYDLQSCVEDEQEYEQDTESELPARLAALCQEAGEILCEMAEEETQEAVDATEKAAFIDTLRGLAKVGARHSGADKDRLQKIHDHSVEMGADCPASAEKAVVPDTLMKALGMNDESAALEELTKLRTYANNWLSMPAPAKGSLRAVAKTDDGQVLEKSATEKARDVEIERAAESGDPLALMKVVHKYGGRAGDTPLRK